MKRMKPSITEEQLIDTFRKLYRRNLKDYID